LNRRYCSFCFAAKALKNGIYLYEYHDGALGIQQNTCLTAPTLALIGYCGCEQHNHDSNSIIYKVEIIYTTNPF
jgi:hypothetical protein